MGGGTSSDSGKEAADDPSMEDILASIRRILSDDEAPAGQPAPIAAEHAATSPAPAVPAATPDEVFVLDQSMLIEVPATMVAEPAPKPADTMARVAPEHAVPPAPSAPGRNVPEPALRPAAPATLTAEAAEPLLAPAAAAAASASMGALVRVLGQQQTEVYRGGPTLEDMVRDEIRPMVKSWLDENLPPIVERMVRAEIARVTNGK